MAFIKTTGSACLHPDGVCCLLSKTEHGLVPVDWGKMPFEWEWKKHPWSNQPDYIAFDDGLVGAADEFIDSDCPPFTCLTIEGSMPQYMRRRPAGMSIEQASRHKVEVEDE